jgi:hypothetical protein
MSDDPIPVRYVLYAHYGAFERDDLISHDRGVPVDDFNGVRHLRDHLRGLRELLTTPGHEGMLVLFYAPGFEEFLAGVAHGLDDTSLLRDSKRLRFAQDVARVVHRDVRREGLEGRVRFLTSLDLRAIIGRVNTIFADQFRRLFVGPAQGIRYDTPKIVEAILRLRLLGNGVPVLRLDHDVIFSGRNSAIGDLGLFKAVACAVRAYQLRLAQPSVSTFLLSASYNAQALRRPVDDLDRFEAWSQAFATRVYPALTADPHAVRGICERPSEERDALWNTYVTRHLNESLVRRYYGLKDDPASLQVEGTSGLTSVGAHPIFAVISGALLCLSEGAILDLPPFSNFRNNVMWIDDHLKYSLHRAMNHFTSGETLTLAEPGLSDARLDDVSVTKARPPVSNLPAYIFGTYLPTLLWGTIVDAWITADPILKCRVGTLSRPDQKRWREARAQQQHNAPLPRAMLEVLRVGHFGTDAEDELNDALQRETVNRIETVRQLWSRLETRDERTFASYWARGEVKETFGTKCFEGCQDNLWEGIASGRPIDQPIRTSSDLSASMAEKVRDLREDAITYVHWTIAWPKFVQIVRSVRQGDFMGDLIWVPQ